MKLKQTAVLAALAAGATINTEEAGFMPGMKVPALVYSPSGAFVGSGVIETSEDGTTWATATGATARTGPALAIQEITLKQKIRLNITAYTSGDLQATFMSDI
jgi:hypothetical protein